MSRHRAVRNWKQQDWEDEIDQDDDDYYTEEEYDEEEFVKVEKNVKQPTLKSKSLPLYYIIDIILIYK
jgi:hypothetical protein